MGGDQLVGAVAGEEVERRLGERIRETEAELYMELIAEVEPLEDARELIADLGSRVDSVVLASSAKQHEVDRYLDLLDARQLVDAWTTSADVEETKPEPDLVHAALDRAGADDALMIGDTTWDCKAAAKAGVATVGVLTGGYSEAELLDAGAVAVFESLRPLRAALDRLPVVGHDGGP
jgi:HAD superfamily hydrolase (TIGR01549 family)